MEPEGNVVDIDRIGFLVALAREAFTGALRFENDGIIKIIYFKDGYILSASTNDRVDSLDEILLRTGKATRDHIRQALSKRKDDESLGDALLGLGFITKRDLASSRRIQVANLIRSLLGWTSGTFAVVPDYLPRRSEGTIFPTNQIVLEVLLTSQDREQADHELDGGTRIPRRTADFDEQYPSLDLNEEADEIISHIDGHRTAAEIAAASSSDSFSVYKLLIGLEAVGLLTGVEADEPEVQSKPYPEAAPTTGLGGMASELDEVPLELVDDLWPVKTELTTEGEEEGETPYASDSGDVSPTRIEDHLPEDEEVPSAIGASLGTNQGSPVDVRHSVSLGGIWDQPDAETRGSMWRSDARNHRMIIAATVVVAMIVVGGGYLLRGSLFGSGRAADAEGARGGTLKLPEIEVPVPERESSPPETSSSHVEGSRAPLPHRPASPTPSKEDPERQRYLMMSENFARTRNPARFTIQFELVCQNESIALALEIGGDSVWFLPTDYNNRQCFRVFWGDFQNEGAASAATNEIPARLRGGTPRILRVSEVLTR